MFTLFIFSYESSICGSTLVQSKLWEKVKFTKQLLVVLSSVVLFHIYMTFTAKSLKPDFKTLHLVKTVGVNNMKNYNVLRQI